MDIARVDPCIVQCPSLGLTDVLLVAGGPKRRKVMKTTINDKGEEVTEEAWEDSQEASPEPQQAASEQPNRQRAASEQSREQRAASEQPQEAPSVSPEKSQQDDALKEQPGKQALHLQKMHKIIGIVACSNLVVVLLMSEGLSTKGMMLLVFLTSLHSYSKLCLAASLTVMRAHF